MSEEAITPEVVEVDPAAPVQETEQPVVSESAPDETAPVPEVAPKPDRAEKRIARLTWEAAEARRETERLRGELERKSQAETRTITPDKDEPKEEDFATAAEYVKAVAKHTYEQAAKADRAEREQQQHTQAQTELQKTVQQRLDAYRKEQPDFDDAMEYAVFNSTALMARELQESEMGPQILYHFAKHPAEANAIAELTDPRKVAKEMAKLEVRLSSAPVAIRQAPTTTPPPLKPVPGSRQAVADLGKIDDDAEYFRQLRANRK